VGVILRGAPIVAGEARGLALVSPEPLSFWGGYDHRSGEITDRRHALSGQVAAKKILVMPFTRGSSTTTAVLLEAIKSGTAPAAILTPQVDAFLALAAIVADEMYALPLPIVALAPDDYAIIRTGDRLVISQDGAVFRDASLG
jgi:predicted aconitase with swiveling domain